MIAQCISVDLLVRDDQKNKCLILDCFRIVQWRAMTLPDRYIDHGSQTDQIEAAGLSSKHIAATASSLIGEMRDGLHLLNV